MRVSTPLLLLAIAGCSEGRLQYPDGTDRLRTAIYDVKVSDGVRSLSLLLSNSTFPCDLPDHEDPAEAELALQEVGIAACREDARHVAIELLQEQGDDWSGVFPGWPRGEASDLGPDRPRLSQATYYGVDEAFLVELDGLLRGYAAERATVLVGLGDGRVEIRHDRGDRLDGSFRFADGELSGTFHATRCTGPTGILDIMFAALEYGCP